MFKHCRRRTYAVSVRTPSTMFEHLTMLDSPDRLPRSLARQVSALSPVIFAIYIDDVSKCSKFYPRSYVILYADDILLYN